MLSVIENLTRLFTNSDWHLVWKNVKPQLEETIRLRRQHAAPKFQELRRQLRQREMKGRFATFRPQLEFIPRHQLFLEVDLLELSSVVELVEENDCTVPLTKCRWLTP